MKTIILLLALISLVSFFDEEFRTNDSYKHTDFIRAVDRIESNISGKIWRITGSKNFAVAMLLAWTLLLRSIIIGIPISFFSFFDDTSGLTELIVVVISLCILIKLYYLIRQKWKPAH